MGLKRDFSGPDIVRPGEGLLRSLAYVSKDIDDYEKQKKMDEVAAYERARQEKADARADKQDARLDEEYNRRIQTNEMAGKLMTAAANAQQGKSSVAESDALRGAFGASGALGLDPKQATQLQGLRQILEKGGDLSPIQEKSYDTLQGAAQAALNTQVNERKMADRTYNTKAVGYALEDAIKEAPPGSIDAATLLNLRGTIMQPLEAKAGVALAEKKGDLTGNLLLKLASANSLKGVDAIAAEGTKSPYVDKVALGTAVTRSKEHLQELGLKQQEMNIRAAAARSSASREGKSPTGEQQFLQASIANETNKAYAALPKEEKEKYGNDINRFSAAFVPKNLAALTLASIKSYKTLGDKPTDNSEKDERTLFDKEKYVGNIGNMDSSTEAYDRLKALGLSPKQASSFMMSQPKGADFFDIFKPDIKPDKVYEAIDRLENAHKAVKAAEASKNEKAIKDAQETLRWTISTIR